MKLTSLTIQDLQRPETISLILGYISAVALALGAGYLVGHQSWTMLTMVAVIVVSVTAAVWLQKRVWILIVFGWLLTGKLLALPLPFSVRDLLTLLALFSYVGHRAVSHQPLRVGWNLIDGFLLLNFVYIGFDYLLHPVGLVALGSEVVGGKPYLSMAFALVAYYLLVRLPDSVKPVSRIPYYWLAAATIVSGLQLLVTIFPPMTRFVYGIYTDVDTAAYVNALTGKEVLVRMKGLSTYGLYVVLVLCSYYPVETLFDPRRGRFYAALSGGVCVLLSGFRNSLLWIMAAFVISGWLQRRWREMAAAAAAAILLLAVVIVGQGRLYDLPNYVQRTLCMLPGQWNPDVVLEAEGSSEWRFQLWKDIIDRHLIKDWWFGDGFGTDIRTLKEMALMGGMQGGYYDFVIETGAYHSGPLTAIRYVGVFGLILLYMLTITGAVYSYKTVQRCRGTPLFPVAVFVAMQLIWDPVHYAFVFGGYNSYLPDVIMMLGILRLLMRFCDQGLAVPTASTNAAPAAVSLAAGAPA